MPTNRHYARAPITEAVIELRGQFGGVPTREELKAIGDRATAFFPHQVEPILRVAVRAKANNVEEDPVSTTADKSFLGYRLIFGGNERIAQIRPDAFVFSQMPPYDRWESLRAAARELWTLYRDALKPTAITRVAVRYINRIDIPLDESGLIDLDDYFLAAPRIPPGLPQSLNSFFVRMQIPLGSENAILAITLTEHQPIRPGFVSAILDLDTFIAGVEITEGEAWDKLEFLRNKKNEAFEAAITDRVRELIS